MKHTVELSRTELEEAIREYLAKNGYCLSDPVYGTPLEFEIVEFEVGNQREPKKIKIATKVVCILD